MPCLVALLPSSKPTKEDFAVAVALERRGVSIAPIKWFVAKRIGHRKNFAAVAEMLSDAGGQSTGLPVWWTQYVLPFYSPLHFILSRNCSESECECA